MPPTAHELWEPLRSVQGSISQEYQTCTSTYPFDTPVTGMGWSAYRTSQVLRPTSYGKWVGGPMSLKGGNFSFQARTAQNWFWMGKYGTNLEWHRSQEAPCTAQPSVNPLGAVLELILASLPVASQLPRVS